MSTFQKISKNAVSSLLQFSHFDTIGLRSPQFHKKYYHLTNEMSVNCFSRHACKEDTATLPNDLGDK